MAKAKKITHDYKCQVCDKPATRNIQDWWHEYSIDEDGEFKEVDNWSGDENNFLCDNCDI